MVKCKLHGKIYGTCCPKEEEICFEDFELEEKELRLAAEAASKSVPSHFDEWGRPRLKIVFVDRGDYGCFPNAKLRDSRKHMNLLKEVENERAREEGIKPPRLIFVIQDRDYWPGTENDSEIMARRAAKAIKSDEGKDLSGFKEIFVASFPGELDSLPKGNDTLEGRSAFMEEFSKLNFMSYYDPSRPGTKFVLENQNEAVRRGVIKKYKADPDLWSKWVEALKADTILEATGFASSSNEMGIDGQGKLMGEVDEMAIDDVQDELTGVEAQLDCCPTCMARSPQ